MHDQLDFVRDFSSTQDSHVNPLVGVQDDREGIQLLLYQQPSHSGQTHPDNRAMGTMHGAECVVDKDVAETGQGGSEGVNGFRGSPLLRPVLELDGAFLFEVEPQVLQQYYRP